MEHLGKHKTIISRLDEDYDPMPTLLKPTRVLEMGVRCGMGIRVMRLANFIL